MRWPFSMQRTGGWREYAEICCVSDAQVDRKLEEKKNPRLRRSEAERAQVAGAEPILEHT